MFTGNQQRVMRDVIDAGPEGAYIGLWSFIARESNDLVEMGAAIIRSVRMSSDTSRSSSDSRNCEWDELYLVATERGQEMYRAARRGTSASVV